MRKCNYALYKDAGPVLVALICIFGCTHPKSEKMIYLLFCVAFEFWTPVIILCLWFLVSLCGSADEF